MNTNLNIKGLRIGKSLTQQQLADESGVTLRTIQRIENGEVQPSLHSLKALSKVLGTDLAHLADQTEKKPYEFHMNIKITDMNSFLTDLKALVITHWKPIAWILLVVWFFSNYTDIKAGIADGWSGN